jgi:hypothetical protein
VPLARSGRIATSVALTMALAGAGACRQIVGVEDRDPPVHCAAAPVGVPACSDCLAASCCAEAEACGLDAPCSARSTCFGACGGEDDGCRSACEAGSKPTEAWAALRACQVGSCADACGIQCGGRGAPVTGCQPCGLACCNAAAACAADLDCNLLDVCRGACASGDAACRERCVNEHPRGASLDRSVGECVGQACDLGADWSCIGELGPTTTRAREVTLSLQTRDGIDDTTIADAELTGCFLGLPSCPSPFATATTDSQGNATLTVPLQGSTYPGFVAAEAPGYARLLKFFYPPIAEDRGEVIAIVRTVDLDSLLADLGVTIVPDRGVAFVFVSDCKGNPAPHVTLHVEGADDQVVVRYASDPGVMAQETTRYGQALLVNLPPGPFGMRGRVEPLCRDSGVVAVVAEADAVTQTTLPPTP